MNLNFDSVGMHPLEDINIVGILTNPPSTTANVTNTIIDNTTTVNTTAANTTPTPTTSTRSITDKTKRLFNNIFKTANANKKILINETEMVSINTTSFPS